MSLTKSPIKTSLHLNTEGLQQGADTGNTEEQEGQIERHLQKSAQFRDKILWTDETKMNFYITNHKKYKKRKLARPPLHFILFMYF